MKKFCFVVMVMAFACGVQAQERQLMKANIPFSFVAENTSFPAGSYTVYLLNPLHMLRVQSLDGGPTANVHGVPSQHESNGKSELVFARIDGQYFLREIRESGNSIEHELSLGKLGRELAAKRHPGPRVDGTVAVSAH